jgi:hypothetical protein
MRPVIDAWAQMIAAARAAGGAGDLHDAGQRALSRFRVAVRARSTGSRGPRGPLWRDAKGMSPGSVRAALAVGQKSLGKLATSGSN